MQARRPPHRSRRSRISLLRRDRYNRIFNLGEEETFSTSGVDSILLSNDYHPPSILPPSDYVNLLHANPHNSLFPPCGLASGGALGSSRASMPDVDVIQESFKSSTLRIIHLNVQGLTPRNLPLFSSLISTLKYSDIIALIETWLKPHYNPTIPGYVCIEKRNRSDGRGGVAVFARSAEDIVCVLISKLDERLWFILHSDIGPLLFCAWYRRPISETDSIARFESEFESLSSSSVGFICVGDNNIHNRTWLRYSKGDSAEGAFMEPVCNQLGLRQIVSKPTCL